MTKAAKTPHQRHVAQAIKYLQDYMNTYDQQRGFLDYSDDVIIDDVLYGLGVALGGSEYQFSKGFKRFKAVLRQHLAKTPGDILRE